MGVSVAIGVGIGAVVGGGAAAIQSGGNFDAIWKGALVGAVGGAVGGWAAPALTGVLGSATLGGMAAGGLGGVTAGVLGTALNGGNSSDYLRNGLFGGLGGAALGGVTSGLGEAFGGQAGATPVDTSGNMVTGTPYTSDVTGATTPLSDAGASTLTQSPVASGVGGGNVDASGAVQSTITGQPTVPNAAEGLQSLTSGITNPSVMTQGIEAPAGSFGTSFDTANSPMQWGSDISYNGPHVPSSNSNTADPFEMGKAWSQPTSQVEAQLAPYAKDMAAQNELMWKGGNNNQPSFFDTLFSKKTGGDMLGKVMAGNMMGQALKGVGAVAGMGEARQNKQQLMDLYNTQLNQYNTQNAAANQYQQQLQNTYSNPNDYLNSPEAEATRQQAMQKLLAQNAAAGRRSAGLAMQNQLMQNQLANLGNYRQGLATAARGAYASPTGLGVTLQGAQQQSPTGNLFAGLGSMFAPAATYYLL